MQDRHVAPDRLQVPDQLRHRRELRVRQLQVQARLDQLPEPGQVRDDDAAVAGQCTEATCGFRTIVTRPLARFHAGEGARTTVMA